jgi:hypothetical protein
LVSLKVVVVFIEKKSLDLFSLIQEVLEELDLLAAMGRATAWGNGAIAIFLQVTADFLGGPFSPFGVPVLMDFIKYCLHAGVPGECSGRTSTSCKARSCQ